MDEKKQASLDRDRWIKAAYDTFETDGFEAVRIDPLAKKLGVTRGSFYWHFKNLSDLLAAVLERWRDTQTDAVIDHNEAAGGDPRARLLRLLETCAGDEGQVEMAIRLWMAKDDTARAIVADVDARRTAYIAQLLTESGLDQAQAARRAPVAYSSWLGEYSGAVIADKEQRLENMRALFDVITLTP